MARKHLIYGVGTVGLLGVIALAFLTPYSWPLRESLKTSSLSTVLATAPISARQRLYSGELNAKGARQMPMERGVDITAASGVTSKRFLKNADGSLEVIELKADGEHFALRTVYYPEQPGEIGWRLHSTQIYAEESDLVLDEVIDRLDGTRQEHTINGEAGNKHVIGYGADGLTIIHELVVNARQNQWTSPVLQHEERWREDVSHSLAYSNVLNLADKKRTITDWDDQHRPIKVLSPNEYAESHYGTETTAYYPGTTRVRMHSKVDSEHNIAEYFRLDGTLDHVLKLSFGYTIVQYFNASGKRMLLEQWWQREDKADKKSTYRLSTIYVFDANGEKTRQITYWDGKLGMIEDLNEHLDGVDYGQVDRVYDADTATLKSVKFWIGKADHVYDKEETHTPSENIRAPLVPADLLTMRINPDEDPDLLLPDPMSDPG